MKSNHITNDLLLFPNKRFDEVVIADLSHFQVAVPTTSKLIKKRIFSTWVSVPERIYDSQGWLICARRLVAYIKGLEVGAIFSQESPFEPIKRINPTIPISFKTEAICPLPRQVSHQAVFACQFTDEELPYHAVFQNVVPRFTNIYSFEEGSSLLDKVEQMLAAETLFISQNYERLKRVPFYRENFGL